MSQTMNTILKYHFRQIINYWRHLKFRIQVEAIILIVIFYSYFAGKFVQYFDQLLIQQDVSPMGLSLFILHGFFLVVAVLTPFIYFNLFPKQSGLINLSLYAFTKYSALILLLIYFIKYQIMIILIATPIFTALTISTGPFILVYILMFAGSSLFLSSTMILVLVSKNQSRIIIFFYYYLFFFLYFASFAIVYTFTQYYFYYCNLVILSGWIVSIKSWNREWQSWDHLLNKVRPVFQKSSQSKSKLTYYNFPNILPKTIQPLLIKEILSHSRNKNYIRLKIISFLFYIAILIFIDLYYIDYYASGISLMTILLIWEHYSHQFNEKYVAKESKLLIKVLPIKFYQYSLSKFLSEFLYIILVLLFVLFSTLIHGISPEKIMNVLSIISLFSLFVLYIMTLIRIIFYDNPRAAGYAYHFLIIFTVIMNLQFYLVGPIITLFIIIYLHIKSQRQFAR